MNWQLEGVMSRAFSAPDEIGGLTQSIALGWYQRRRWRAAQATTQVFEGSLVAKVISYNRLEDVGNDKASRLVLVAETVDRASTARGGRI